MTQQADPPTTAVALAAGQAQVIVTYDGHSGDLPDTVDINATHDQVRTWVQEALRSGGVRGLAAIPDADVSNFIVDPCPPTDANPTPRLLVRPKTGFGGHDGYAVGEKPKLYLPHADRVLIKRVKADDKTKGGIIIPDNAKEKPIEATIVAVGPGKVLANGRRVEPCVKAGDRILFGKFAGQEVSVGGEDQLYIREEDIFAVIEA